MNKVYILGGSQTDFERNWFKEGKTIIAMLKEVIHDTFNECHIQKKDLEKLKKNNRIEAFVGNFIGEKYLNQGHLGGLLTEVDPIFYGVPSARYEAACASSSVALESAITKIKSGDIDMAIVVGFEMMKTVDSHTCGDILGYAAYYEKEAQGIDYPFPNLFAKLADEIIIKYHLDKEQFLKSLATISNINYENAKKNPNAQTRNWFINSQQTNLRGDPTNKIISGLLANTDCSQITDGAAAVILVSENYKKNKKLPIVKGYGHRNAPMLFTKKMQESASNDYILPWTRQAVLDAYKQANLSVDDIDVFETHDCFTSSEYVAISAFGLTKPGHEYEVIDNNDIAFNGKYPINPSGGLIGCGHPVGASGVRMFLDIYKQVASKAGKYQIKNAKNALMLNLGGTATTNYCFIVGQE